MKLVNLATLFHNANQGCTDKRFYELKNKFLREYATFVGFDVQFIEGKKCFSCWGSGSYHGVPCYECDGSGWFKQPFYSFLERYEIREYSFHLPYKKVINPKEQIPFNIEGYIEKRLSALSEMSVDLIYKLDDNGILFQNIH